MQSLRGDVMAHLAAFSLEQGSLFVHSDGIGGGAHFEGNIDARSQRQLNLNSRPDIFIESSAATVSW